MARRFSIVFALLWALTGSALGADRVALVIGNAQYKSIGALPNAASDAGAIANSLRDLGYETTLVLDANELELRRAVRQFANTSMQASVAVVFYAGHGTQVSGENYLLPVIWLRPGPNRTFSSPG